MLTALPTAQDLVQKQQSMTTTMLLPLETMQKFNELDAEFIQIERKKLEDKIWKLKQEEERVLLSLEVFWREAG